MWTRWGRVGEPGQNAIKTFSEGDEAEKEFKKKFFEKTKNHWDNRDKFVPVPGKYTLIGMNGDDDDDDDYVVGVNQVSAPCTLMWHVGCRHMIMRIALAAKISRPNAQVPENLVLDRDCMPSPCNIFSGLVVHSLLTDVVNKNRVKHHTLDQLFCPL